MSWTKAELAKYENNLFGKAFAVQTVTTKRYESESGWVGVEYVDADGNRVAMSSIAWAAKAKAIKWDEKSQSYVGDTVNLGRNEKGRAINQGVPPKPRLTKEAAEALTIPQLKEKADELGLEYTSKADKAALVALVATA